MNLFYKILILLIPPFLWSFNFVFGRYFSNTFDPIDLSFYRWTIAFFIVILIWGKQSLAYMNVLKRNLLLPIILALLGITFFNTILYFALRWTTAINSVLIASTTPVMILSLNIVFMRYSVRPLELLALPLSIIGVLFILSQGELAFFTELSANKGDVLAFLSALIWALYSVWVPKLSALLPPMPMLTITISIGWIFLLFIFVLYHLLDLSMQTSAEIGFEAIIFLIYVGIFASIVAYVFWNKAVSEIGSSMAGICLNFTPVFAVISSSIFLKEALHPYHFWGALCIALALFLVFQKNIMQKKLHPDA